MKELTKEEGVNLKKEGSECMICHYFYDSNGFKYQSYVCNR